MKKQRKKPSALRRAASGSKRLTVAAGVGAAIGAAAALLFAPKTGSKMRKDVKRQVKKSAQALAKQKTAIEHELHAVVESMPPAARRSLNLAKSRLTKAVVSAKGALTSARYHDMVDAVLSQFDHESDAIGAHLEKAKKQWKRAFAQVKKHLK